MVLTAVLTNWTFEFARTAKIFSTKFANGLKKCKRLLSAFANVCYFFTIKAFISIFGRLTHL